MNEFWRQMIASIKSMSSPMRPEAAEVALIEATVAAHQRQLQDAPGQALLLGVTEEIVTMDWPGEVMLDAVDRSEAMIGAFWKGDVPGRRRLRQANWWEMDDRFGPYRYAIGDGVFNLQSYPDNYQAFAARLHSVMEPGGLGFFRVFSQPGGLNDDVASSATGVIERYRSGELSEFQQLRFNLAIALQQSTREGIALNIPGVVRQLEQLGLGRREQETLPDFDSVAKPMLAFDEPHSLRMYHPTREEFEAAVEPWFELTDTGFGKHPLAGLCPTYTLRARE